TILTGVRCSQGSMDACNLLATPDPNLLAGILCAQGSSSDCATLKAQDPSLFANVNECVATATIGSQCAVQAICNSLPMSDPTAGGPNPACPSPGDGASANCVIGSDGVNGTCQPCGSFADCPGGGGICTNGVCMLGLATNQILEPAACTPVNPPFK